MLLKYRARHLEDYDEDAADKERQEKLEQRAPSVMREPIEAPPASTNKVIEKEVSNLSVEPVAPTARVIQAPAGPRSPPPRRNLDVTPVIQIHAATPERDMASPPNVVHKALPPTPALMSAPSSTEQLTISQPPVSSGSPVLPPIDIPAMGDANMQRFFLQIVEHLNTMQPRTSIISEESRRTSPTTSVFPDIAPIPAPVPAPTPVRAPNPLPDSETSQFADAEEDASSAGGSNLSSFVMVDSRLGASGAEYGLGITNHIQRLSAQSTSAYSATGTLRSTRSSVRNPSHNRVESTRRANILNMISAPPAFARRPISKPSYASSNDGSPSDKENDAPRKSAAPRPSLKSTISEGSSNRRNVLGDRRVQIVLPGEEAKLKPKKSWSSKWLSD